MNQPIDVRLRLERHLSSWRTEICAFYAQSFAKVFTCTLDPKIFQRSELQYRININIFRHYDIIAEDERRS